MMDRAPFTVAPELRRLRAAWAWARREHPAANTLSGRCGAMTEATPGPRAWVMTATTDTGGGVCITINDRDELVVIAVEKQPMRLAIPLPAHIAQPGGGRA